MKFLIRDYVDRQEHSSVDHVTIGSISRNILEAQVFLGYLTEPELSKEEWQLRKWTLDIHDCNSQIRLFRSLGDESQTKKGKRILEYLRKRIKKNKLFENLPDETKTAIYSGSRMYVRGMRAALELSGWDRDEWDGIYTYLSGSAHSMPISFYRSDMKSIDNLTIQPFQVSFVAFSLEMAQQAISWANGRMLEVFPDVAEKRALVAAKVK